MRSKGQISGLDLIVASMIIVFIMMSAMEVWNTTILQINKFNSKKDVDNKLLNAAEMLVKTPGDPVDWHEKQDINAQTVNTIGLAKDDNVLDTERLERLSSIEYEQMKQMIGLSKEEFYLTIKDLESPDKTILYEAGTPTQGTRVSATRYALLNDTLVELKLTLYYDETTFMNM